MISRRDILEWRRSRAPWKFDAYVEQDLLLHWMLIEMYSNELINSSLAFRGGTALNTLHLQPAARYSEDIDFVQIDSGPIGPVMNIIREKFDPHFGKPARKQNRGSVKLIYRYESEIAPVVPMKIKIEINTREHFSALGYQSYPLAMDSVWHRGQADLKTYHLDELMGTKLRALYQRKKGRDLFDLWFVLNNNKVNLENVLNCFSKYMLEEEHQVSRDEFRENLSLKIKDKNFLGDTEYLLREDIQYNPEIAFEYVDKKLLNLLP